MMKKPSMCILLICLLVGLLPAEEYYSEDFYYSLDLPADWYIEDDSDSSQVIFASEEGDAGILVGVFEYEPEVDKGALLETVVDRMHMTGTYDTTTFINFKAVRGNYRFQTDGMRMSAELIIFQTPYYFFMIMGTSLAETASRNKKVINQIIDSFMYESEEGEFDDYDAEEWDYTDSELDTEADYYEVTQKDQKSKSGTTDTSVTKKGSSDQEYLIDIDWGDYLNKFAFHKPDYYSAVKEGEAIVKSGNMYAYYRIDTDTDPDYSQTFWARFYQDMYNKNFRRVANMVDWFREKAKAEGWSAYELAAQVIKCIQVIPYERPYNVVRDSSKAANTLDYFTPNEVAWYNKGDCDTKSLLIVMVLRQLGYEANIFYSAHYAHAMAGVVVNASGNYLLYQSKKYYFIESTYPGWKIGDLPPDFGNSAYWTLIPIK